VGLATDLMLLEVADPTIQLTYSQHFKINDILGLDIGIIRRCKKALCAENKMKRDR
jgi:hypothetical protein